MVKRPRQHIEEAESKRIFNNSIPTEWIIREIKPDYGIDLSIEIVENGNVTGNVLFVQLKGVEKLKIIGDHVSFRLKVNHLRYYMQRDDPIILVVVDIKDIKCYWIYLQKYVYEILNISNPL